MKKLITYIIPSSIKGMLFRGMFYVMPEWLQDYHRRYYGMTDIRWCLKNLKNRGFAPKGVIDIGAYNGNVTDIIMEIFPNSHVLMIEALPEMERYLKEVRSRYPESVDYKISLLGASNQDAVQFYKMETGSSVLGENSNVQRKIISLPMKTLDDIINEKKFKDVSFLKLDVQGYEIEVLKGAANALKNVEVVLMEVALLQHNMGAPLLHEVVSFMSDHGFLTYDICSFIRYMYDNKLIQIDAIFVRKDSILRSTYFEFADK